MKIMRSGREGRCNVSKMDRMTFVSICERWGQPIAIYDIDEHPLRSIRSKMFVLNPDPFRIAVWKIDEQHEGGIIIGCTWHDPNEFPEGEWHLNSGHRQLVRHLMDRALRSGEKEGGEG